jgi:CHAT domain-containing protein/tetratricopeptide (TPR) repeat protein
MSIRYILFFIFLFGGYFLQAQGIYDQLKTQYDRLRKEEKHDSALVAAKQMNTWTLQNETDTSLRYFISLKHIANCFYQQNYDSSIYYFNKALDVLKFQNREISENFTIILRSLGNIYSEIEKYDDAIIQFEKTVSIYEKLWPDSLIKQAFIHDNLGELHKKKYEFQQALNEFERAEKLYGKNTNSINQINIAVLFSELGDFKQAKEKFQLVEQKLYENKSIAENDVAYYKTLSYCINGLGKLYLNQGLLTEAQKCYEHILEIDNKYTVNSDNNGWHLINYGKVLKLKKKFFDSNKSYQLAIEIFRKNNNLSDLAKAQIYLADLKGELGDLLNADSLYLSSITLLKERFGESNYDFLKAKNDYAIFLMKNKNLQLAYEIFNHNFFEKSRHICNNFEWLDDNQKEAYWKKESKFFENLSWFTDQSFQKVPESVGLNYNATLLTKGKMLEAKISRENYYREVDELREELVNKRRLLAKMESDGTAEKDRLEKLHEEADSLDKRLTLSWLEYAQQKKNLSITWDQVQQNLDQGEAAIEFVRFKNEDDSLYYYNALVLKKGESNPSLIKLCKEEELTAIVPKMGYSAYYPLIWQPLENTLIGIKTIYYAPSGELYNVPFHAIYAPKGKGDEVIAAKTDKRGVVIQNEKGTTEQNAEYLIDRYTLHQLTSTRYLAMGLKQKEKEKIGNNMAMVGGVNYDYLPGTQNSTQKSKKEKNASRSSQSANGKLSYLEGTKTEVDQIVKIVTPNNWQTILLEKNDATTEKIIQLEHKEAKSILHIATHGFAFSEFDFNDTLIDKNSLRYNYRYNPNPMLRCGLILAGGNWAWTGSDTLKKLGSEENGILTALDISLLNLKKTKLVVLSACETGLGKIEGSEGTFGLKRGFKLAGVEQMIVSLWSVPDKETMELMTLFYSDLTKTLNPVSSFEKAQKEMRYKYPTDPEKWAGFILVR